MNEIHLKHEEQQLAVAKARDVVTAHVVEDAFFAGVKAGANAILRSDGPGLINEALLDHEARRQTRYEEGLRATRSKPVPVFATIGLGAGLDSGDVMEAGTGEVLETAFLKGTEKGVGGSGGSSGSGSGGTSGGGGGGGGGR